MNYDHNIRYGRHLIKVTLQSSNYTGSFILEIDGNCKGSKILEEALDPDFYNYNITKNYCSLVMIDEPDDDNNYWFKCELKNDKDEILIIEDTCDSIGDYVVAVCIIDYQEIE